MKSMIFGGAAAIIVAVAMITLPKYALAQPTNEELLLPIRNLFKGMLKGDSTLASAAFYPGATLATVTVDKSGAPMVRAETVTAFMKAIASPHAEEWDERFWDPQIRVDGNFAQVWTPYAFYLGGKFSHCGVDAFHLIKTARGWKIFHLADTRQKEGCIVPETGK